MMKPADMVKFRYQLVVDGYSASYDSSFWKLKCNSTPLYFISDAASDCPYWMLWWFSGLMPMVHYIPVSNGTISVALNHCKMHESFCRRIAMNAHEYVLQFVTVTHAIKYMQRIMLHLLAT